MGAPRLQNVHTVATGLDRPEAQLEEYVDAMVEALNRRGGVACRRVRIVWHDVDFASNWFGPAGEQAMCATWTQDHSVFAAFPGGVDGPGDVLYPCLDRAGVAIIDVRGLSFRDGPAFDEVPRLLLVNGSRLDRTIEHLVDALVRVRFLTSDARLGVVHYDAPVETRTVDATLTRALAAHGLSIAERRAVTTPTDVAALAARDRDVANAALRFKLTGIDRVVFVSGDGLAAGFMHAAESNHYRPRYGLTSVELPVVALEVPARQLLGARGIGWFAESDRHPQHPESWPARTTCLDFFHQKGFSTPTLLDRIFAAAACDAVWFTEAAIAAAPSPLSADAAVAGAATLGEGYRSPTVGPTHFRDGRRDGAATYRDVAYAEECACFVYTGQRHPLR